MLVSRPAHKPLLLFIVTAISLSVLSASAQQPAAASALPYTPSLDPAAMDRTADPCVDFYQYACGGWMKANPIPPDQTSWSVYGKLYEDNLAYLRGILEQASSDTHRDPVTQKIGDYYAACMDESAIDKLGAQPLRTDLAAIQNLSGTDQLPALIATLHLQGVFAAFNAGPTQDPDNSNDVIMEIAQGGLGLPDRDYYIATDAKSQETRARYLQHVQKVFELLGDSPTTASANAEAVMRIETDLAKASLTRVQRRDPYLQKHKMTVADLDKVAPGFNWSAYFAAAGVPQFQILNVQWPEFFKALTAQINSAPISDWKTYLRFHLANARAPQLSSAFVDEDFSFYRKYLRGAAELQPRWKRCVRFTDEDLGEALGQAYVRKTFSPQLKAATLEMTRHIEDAMALRIQQLDWMTPETKQQALIKLHAIRNKIGYPDTWRDYNSVNITPTDYYGDHLRAVEFESRRQVNKIGKPVNRAEWFMTPPTVNAYYDPQMNDINFPAGVLQPPLYDAKMDAAPNYGNTGSTIGHELTHGFDDQGRQYDAAGNLKNWWTKQDTAQFTQRAGCVVDQYSHYTVVDNIHINSKLTEGEDIADFGGTILAYIAWKDATKGQTLQPRDGLTPDQRFFVGFAQWACENNRPEDLRVHALTDPHSPGKYRINGVVVNMPEFATAFSCKAGQPMVTPADQLCHIW